MNGLLGKSLKHSLSKEIHEALGSGTYQLIETDDVVSFLQKRDFQMVNVTIPYKEQVLSLLDEVDPLTQAIQAVNTIVNRNQKLVGYNTDYDGLKSTFEQLNLSLEHQHVVIIGHGGMAKCAAFLAKEQNASSIQFLVRNPKHPEDVAFQDIHILSKTTVLIQATPLGMFPAQHEPMPFSLSSFPHLIGFIDTIYNPLRTTWLLEAKKRQIPSANGLYQLVVQAARAREISEQVKIPFRSIKKIYMQLKRNRCNIVLVGLPFSGKTTVGMALAEKLHLPWIDTDQTIMKQTQLSIDEIFETKGESYFRSLEEELAIKLSSEHPLVISTGGGMIENPIIMKAFLQTGLVIYLKKDPVSTKGLDITGRPLLKFPEAMFALHQRRAPLYEELADFCVAAQQPVPNIVSEIEVFIDAYFNREWT